MTVQIAPEVKLKLQNPEWTLNNLYRIIDKDSRDIPFRLNWAQRQMFYNMHTRNIILKCRQIGSSTFWCIYMLNKALFQRNQRVGIIAHKLSAASDIFNNIIKHAIKTLPPKIALLPQCQIVKDSAREIHFANGSSIRVDTTMRSGTLSGLLITEFGKICARNPMKAEEIITGCLNAVPDNALCVMESTAEGKAGKFYDMWQDSWMNRHDGEYNELEWKPIFFPWYDEPTYTL